MSKTDDTAELEELQPLEEPAATAGGPPPVGAVPPPTVVASGLVSPALNPNADKEYYRFLFAGVVMLLGCLMPFGPEWEMAGYKTLRGAFYTLIALGMIWSWWGAIATNRFSGKNLKWVFLAFLPFIIELMGLVTAFDAPAVRGYVDAGKPIATDWSMLWEAMTSPREGENTLVVGNFFRAYGTGKIVVFVGALLAEIFMLMAVFGGVKQVNQQKAAKAAARREGAGSPRRR